MTALSLQNPEIRGTDSRLPLGGKLGIEKVCGKGPVGTWAQSASSSYHPFDAFGEEEAVVQSVHSIIWENFTLLLEKKVPGVQAIICPENGKPPFFVSMNESPREQKSETLSLAGRTTEKDALGADFMAPAILQYSPSPCPLGGLSVTLARVGKRRKMVFIDTNHVPGIVVKVLYDSCNLIFPRDVRSSLTAPFLHAPFTDKETEAQRGEERWLEI